VNGTEPSQLCVSKLLLQLPERVSWQTAALIDEEVQQLISERYTYVYQLLSQHQQELERIARALLERESLDEEQLQRLLEDAHKNTESVSESKASSEGLAVPARQA
jgi:cell division protease FtsH